MDGGDYSKKEWGNQEMSAVSFVNTPIKTVSKLNLNPKIQLF